MDKQKDENIDAIKEKIDYLFKKYISEGEYL